MPNDDLAVAKTENDDSASGILADLLDGGFAALLDDKDVKHACLKELADVGCRAPANHVVWFCVRKLASAAEGFASETLKSKFVDILEANPTIAGVLRRISNLKSAEKDKNTLKQRLLEDLNATTADDAAMMAEMTTELEVVAALHTRSALQGLSGKIADLAKEIGATLETVLRDMTEPRLLTAGVDGNWERDSNNLSVAERLKYNSGQYGFYGRERELDVLGNFLHQIDPTPGLNRFRWLLLTGPGGEGKSRLALEFCKNHVPAPWLAGKLELDELRAMTSGQFKWRPRRPTLFVIDYPAQAPDAVNALLRMLDRDWREFNLPVRVLLLERETTGEWFKKLLPENSASAGLNDHVFGNLRNGYPVPPLSPQAVTTLMAERFNRAYLQPPEPHLLLIAALKIDPRGIKTDEGLTPAPRALFASAVAELMVEAAQAGDSDFECLVAGLSQHQILDRLIEADRRNRWKPACNEDDEKLEQHENLLALATMCLGLSRASLNSPDARSLRGEILPNSLSPTTLNAMGTSLPERQISTLEPDILGEHYALSRLEKLQQAGLAQDLIDAAFNLGGSDFCVFCLRSLFDFRDRAKSLEIFFPSESVNVEGGKRFADLAVDLSYTFSELRDWDYLDRIFVRLNKLRAAFPDDIGIAIREAMVAVNVTADASKAGEWTTVDAMITRLKHLRKRFPADMEILLEACKAAINSASSAGEAGEWQRVHDVFAELDTIRQSLPTNCAIALKEAECAFNTATNAGKHAQWELVDAMFDRISALRASFPQNLDIALNDAEASTNTATSASKVLEWRRTKATLHRLGLLQGTFPEALGLALTEAQAIVNVIGNAGVAGEWHLIEGILARLETLRVMFPESEEMALRLAMATANICSIATEASGWDCMEAMYRRATSLISTFKNEPRIVAVSGHAIAARYATHRCAHKSPSEHMTSEAAAAAGALVFNPRVLEFETGVPVCLMVIKDAARRFPKNRTISEVFRLVTQKGFDWQQVADFER